LSSLLVIDDSPSQRGENETTGIVHVFAAALLTAPSGGNKEMMGIAEPMRMNLDGARKTDEVVGTHNGTSKNRNQVTDCRSPVKLSHNILCCLFQGQSCAHQNEGLFEAGLVDTAMPVAVGTLLGVTLVPEGQGSRSFAGQGASF